LNNKKGITKVDPRVGFTVF